MMVVVQNLGQRKEDYGMNDKLEVTGQRLAGLLTAGEYNSLEALVCASLTESDRKRVDTVLLALRESTLPASAFGVVAEALKNLRHDADGFSVLAESLETNGAALAAHAAQKCAAVLDFEAHPTMDVWGGAFNGQSRRQDLFDQLLRQLKIVAIVETGTFRGTSTAYMAKTGLPVMSCELHPRYFHYASLRLADSSNVRLEQADSRRFLRQVFDQNLLPSGPSLFYLDAHWEQDLPLWEEVRQIFARHPAPVVMVDDFRVPTDSGFAYDNYGRGRCLSVSNLCEAVTARPTIFFPNYASGEETGARRGCVVLAQAELADLISRGIPTLTELSWTDALILDGISELRTGVVGTNSLESKLTDADARADGATARAEVERERADRADQARTEAQSYSARLELRVHEVSGAIARAEFAHRQEELKAENSSHDAAAAREAVAKLQALVLRLHEELHSARQTSTLDSRRAIALSEEREAELEQKLRLAEARAEQELRLVQARAERTTQQVAELQHSRWRRIGLRLGLARKATFEI
jgi:predicted O-methyltransferase YrrM